MEITLAQAISSMFILKKEISRLNRELSAVAFETVDKGSVAESQERTFSDVFSDFVDAQKALVDLTGIIRTVNVNEVIMWNDEQISISKAIEVAKSLRNQASALAGFANTKKKESVRSYNGEYSYKIAMFEPAQVAELAKAYERQAARLSSLIEARNHTINLEIPFLEKYI